MHLTKYYPKVKPVNKRKKTSEHIFYDVILLHCCIFCSVLFSVFLNYLTLAFGDHPTKKVGDLEATGSFGQSNKSTNDTALRKLIEEMDRWESVAQSYNPLKAGSIDGTDTIPHDHGIVRAMLAEYKPNKEVVGDPDATVFVGRLNHSTDEMTLRKIFSECGKIKRLRLVTDIVTGFSKGYAFIEYYEKRDALKAQRDLDRTVIDSKEVIVDAECERSLPGWIPRRLGGGLSGKKESGQLRFGGKVRPFKKPLFFHKKRNSPPRIKSYSGKPSGGYRSMKRSPQRSIKWKYEF